MASVLALRRGRAVAAGRAAVAGWPAFARTVCESVSGGTCPPRCTAAPRYELGLAAVAFLGGVTMIMSRLAVRPEPAPGQRPDPGPRRGRPHHRPAREAAERGVRAGCRAARRVLRAGPAADHRAHHRRARGPGSGAAHGGTGARARAPGRAAPSAARADPVPGRGRPRRSALRAGNREVARLAEMRADDVAARSVGGAQGRRTLAGRPARHGRRAALVLRAGPSRWPRGWPPPAARSPPASGAWLSRRVRLAGSATGWRWPGSPLAIAAASALVVAFAVAGISLPGTGTAVEPPA